MFTCVTRDKVQAITNSRSSWIYTSCGRAAWRRWYFCQPPFFSPGCTPPHPQTESTKDMLKRFDEGDAQLCEARDNLRRLIIQNQGDLEALQCELTSLGEMARQGMIQSNG